MGERDIAEEAARIDQRIAGYLADLDVTDATESDDADAERTAAGAGGAQGAAGRTGCAGGEAGGGTRAIDSRSQNVVESKPCQSLLGIMLSSPPWEFL